MSSELKQDSKQVTSSLEEVEVSENGMSYAKVDKKEFEKLPEIAIQRNEVIDDRSDEIRYLKSDKDEVHILPTLKVKENPVIIEKEIEYEKPVYVKQTIIHQEKPIIIEQPIIKEKNIHYREDTQYIKHEEKVIKEKLGEQDVGNLDKEEIAKLRTSTLMNYADTTPIIEQKKENIQLQADIREQPTMINEKQVIYQQPVEIEQTTIEKIKPSVHEQVTIEKQHIHEKLAPQIHVENTTQIYEGDEYYSKDTIDHRKIVETNPNPNSNLTNPILKQNDHINNNISNNAGQEPILQQ